MHLSVQLIQVWHQLIFQDVVDHLLHVISILLQAGQDESLTKVWQQVLHLGDQRVQLHAGHAGDGRGRSTSTLPTPNTTGGYWGGTELRAGSVHRNTGESSTLGCQKLLNTEVQEWSQKRNQLFKLHKVSDTDLGTQLLLPVPEAARTPWRIPSSSNRRALHFQKYAHELQG